MPAIHIVSSRTLEDWDWRNPWTKGIGGSETSHIEMAFRLAKRGFDIYSYSPTPDKTKWHHREYSDNTPLVWRHSERSTLSSQSGIIINYRDPKLFEVPKPQDSRWWFVAQDVDYPWTPEALAKVDRYICLCKKHVEFTNRKYPQLRGRVYVSSNGVRKDYLDKLDKSFAIKREPYSMLYASSPDRGLKLLLEQWWRIKERFPRATLRVAYGFDNLDTIIRAFGDPSRQTLKSELERLLYQAGVTWLGRIGQAALYREWLRTSVWPYPSDWPETSCITCMDAQACGAIPVTTNYWAQGANTHYGYVNDGLPQRSELARNLWLNNLYRALEESATHPDSCGDWVDNREDMMQWSRGHFDWENIVTQWQNWIEEDSKKL